MNTSECDVREVFHEVVMVNSAVRQNPHLILESPQIQIKAGRGKVVNNDMIEPEAQCSLHFMVGHEAAQMFPVGTMLEVVVRKAEMSGEVG